MSIEALKSNIAQEKELVNQLDSMFSEYQGVTDPIDKQNVETAINSTQNQLKILNDSLPSLLDNIKFTKKLPDGGKSKEKDNLVSVSYIAGGGEKLVAIQKKNKNNYLEHLRISSDSLKELKKRDKKTEEEFKQVFKKPNFYIKTSNKFFNDYATKIINQGNFNSLKLSLQKGGFNILFNSYVAVLFFTTLLAGIIAILAGIFFLFFNISPSFPFVFLADYSQMSFLARFAIIFFAVLSTPVIVFLTIFYYPSTEQSSVEQKIDYELPFATIQMSAIAGANIEPSNIFRIIALSKEYPYIRKEAKKLLNQINLYGYSFVTALRNSAMLSPSKEWAELLNGISTTIRSGGKLSRFLNKRAETLLFEYRLKREKATKFAETFMDIYISVVIAAPMLIMLLLVMMSISGLGLSFPVWLISVIIVSIVSFINIVALMFLQVNQKQI